MLLLLERVVERDNTRMKYFLASLSQSQMACDSGLFHSCNTASNKDGRTVLFLVINWVFVGVKILPTLTSRQVLTQRRGKEWREYTGPIYFDQSCFLARSPPQTARAVKTIFPGGSRPWHLKTNAVSHTASGNHSRAGGESQQELWGREARSSGGQGYVDWRLVSGSGRGGTELQAMSSFSFWIPTQNKIRLFKWLIMQF